MKTCTDYHALAAHREALLKAVTALARKAVPIERLYLLGLSTATHRTESLFSSSSLGREEVAHAWFFVVVDKEGSHILNGVQDKLEAHLRTLLPATVIVLSAASFTRWLAEDHPFAVAVCQHGYSLYRKENLPLPVEKAVNEDCRRREWIQLFLQTERKVREFMAGAELYTVRMHYPLAAFMLHQAAEQALQSLLILHTGLRLSTHNLDKLVRCNLFVVPVIQSIFPRNTESEKKLFALLQQAYLDSRYQSDFTLTFGELVILTKRVKHLQTLLEETGAVQPL